MRLIAIAALVFLASTPIAAAQIVQAPGTPPILGTVLSIDADGKSTGRPDQAMISVGVVTEAPNAAPAMSQNAQQMTALMRALRNAGVAERDIRTSNISVQPQQVYRSGEAPHITGYEATNEVRVILRNLDAMGRTIDAAIGAGGNRVNSISFTYADPTAQLDAARRAAVAEARRRADLYAQALSMHVFRIIAVSEGGGVRPYDNEEIVVSGSRIEGVPTTPVAPGEMETRLQVHVTFELR